MQALVRYTFTDYARFRAAFDADAEDRGLNGLSLLQLWREGQSEGGGSAWALYQVNDAKSARAYLSGGDAAFASQAGAAVSTVHFVETA